jgi:Mycothiol maleylpyruvate isomerase N-terminal domain
MDRTWLRPPLDLRPLFPVERGALVDLLAALEPDEWSRATVCPGWAVRDVAGHILHGYVRRLSAGRDRHPGPEFGSRETLAAFLARTNEDFVRTARQIRDAVGHPGATEPRLLHPVLDTFMRALPQTLHRTSAPVGTTVRVRVPGPAGGQWAAARRTDRWSLDHDAAAVVAAEVEIGAHTASRRDWPPARTA